MDNIPAMNERNRYRLFRWLFFAWAAAMVVHPLAYAQEGPAKNEPASPAISVSTSKSPMSPAASSGPTLASAMLLYRAKDYDKTSREYNALIVANPSSANAYSGLARVYVKQAKLGDALSAAKKAVELDPTNPIGHTALGEVYFRMGKITEAEAEFVPIVKAGQGYGRAYLGEARVSWASSYYKQAKRMIDLAHKLDSGDPEILDLWMDTENVEERIRNLKEELADPANTDPKRQEQLEQTLLLLTDAQIGHSACRTASKVSSLEVPFALLLNDPRTYRAAGLKLAINGTSATLMVDTGASGILIGSKIAAKAGVTRVTKTSIGGIGDRGDQSGYIGHVDSIKLGDLEFRDCYVEVTDKRSALDDDGLVGADLFRNFLVDLDFSGRKFRLSELPPRPADGGSASSDAQDVAQFQNRYVAPEMKSYTPVFRFGHDLLVPTRINDSIVKLFLIDSGSMSNSISPVAAREVTKVGADSYTTVKGLSGSVKNVYRADKAILTFGRLRQQNQDIIGFDTTSISESAGTEVSGILGFATLGMLDVKIDYRYGLVNFTFDQQKWCQGKCR
jgi:tetratricopeptide (TPR) repeat protein